MTLLLIKSKKKIIFRQANDKESEEVFLRFQGHWNRTLWGILEANEGYMRTKPLKP